MLMKSPSGHALRKRLRPLHFAVLLQGMSLWVPVEKLFLNEIGFDAASVGLMAAAYAAVVPIVEIPSGILADRWSRRGVLVVSSVALVLSAVLGGFAHDVPTYILSMLALGGYFAMYSGTMDAVVYDTVLEETGDGEDFEKRIGRVRVLEAVGLVSSSLLGGWLASLTSPRLMYFLTVPFTVLSIVAYLRFREPSLHKPAERSTLGSHLAMTFHTLRQHGRLLPIVALAVLSALTLQVIFEFGPLWLVAVSAAAVLYGPYWAGLVSTIGLGGALAGRIRFDRLPTVGVVAALMVLSSLVLTVSGNLLLVTGAQILLALLIVAATIHITRLLHDAIPSTIRTGVASGVSALSWLAFLPFALIFGLVTKHAGVHDAAWMIVASAALIGLLLAKLATGKSTLDGPAGQVGHEGE
jgi:predicted MFS family arabinose efflux permease